MIKEAVTDPEMARGIAHFRGGESWLCAAYFQLTFRQLFQSVGQLPGQLPFLLPVGELMLRGGVSLKRESGLVDGQKPVFFLTQAVNFSAEGAEQIELDRFGFGQILLNPPEIHEQILNGIFHQNRVGQQFVSVVVENAVIPLVEFGKSPPVALFQGVPENRVGLPFGGQGLNPVLKIYPN